MRPSKKHSNSIQIASLLAGLQLASCTSATPVHDPRASERGPASLNPLAQSDRYLRDIQPIFSNRCVVCHSCVDAPCQLHLDTYTSLQRGATFSEMGSSLFEGHPTRPKDAKTPEEWRKKGFFPVIAENPEVSGPSAGQHNLDNSLLYRFIAKGYAHNQPGFSLNELDDHRDEDNSCISNVSAFDDFIQKYPGAGMPYGMPALDRASFETLKNWIAEGAPGPSPETVRQLEQPSRPEEIEVWENFLNGSLKNRITGRFFYEHTFSAHIHFEGTPEDEFFELVRSRTPSPQSVDEIVTQRPYDPPQKKGMPPVQVYYRFKRHNRTIVKKTHVPLELNRTRLLAYQRLFLETPWTPQGDGALTEPGYTSNNPFEYFQQIPADIRYRFLLENSRLIVNAMVRGPVCTGRLATEAIREHFWVLFLDPASDVTVMDPTVGMNEWASLDTKAKELFKEKPHYYDDSMRRLKPEGFSLADLWKGDGKNPGAVLTVLRHDASATVHYGPLSGKPDTIWLLNFSNFERIYYNLVVDFKPWGHQLHKLSTWNFMSLHRAEAEERFISFLPTAKLRKQLRTEWTHGLGAYENFFQKRYSEKIPSRIQVRAEAPVESLLEQMLAQMPPAVLAAKDSITPFKLTPSEVPSQIRTVEDWERGLVALTSRSETLYAQYFPNTFIVRIFDQPYTVITNRAFSFNNIVVIMDLAREPEKDTLSAFRGLYTDKPEIFFDLKPEQAANFLTLLQKVRSEDEWKAIKEVFGVRRNDPRVWNFADWLQNWDRKLDPLEAGVFDMLEYDVN